MSLKNDERQFHYGEAVVAFVTRTYPIDPKDRRLYVDAVTLDLRAKCHKCPVFVQPGVERNLRRGQEVLVLYVDGDAQSPIVIAHTPNSDVAPEYADPLSRAFEHPDDFVLTHPETGAFMRFRAVNGSTARVADADGGPCRFEVTFRSRTRIEVEEYNPPGYPLPLPERDPNDTFVPAPIPPPPPRAKFSITMPSLASVVIDEPEPGLNTITIDDGQGFSIVKDALGNLTISVKAGAKVVVAAQDIELGADGARRLAFKDDVDALAAAFNAHRHSGVQAGGAASGAPLSPAPESEGTINTKAY